jgi:hypothetical protein
VNSDYSGEQVIQTAEYTGDIDIEDEPKLHIGGRRTADLLNSL